MIRYFSCVFKISGEEEHFKLSQIDQLTQQQHDPLSLSENEATTINIGIYDDIETATTTFITPEIIGTTKSSGLRYATNVPIENIKSYLRKMVLLLTPNQNKKVLVEQMTSLLSLLEEEKEDENKILILLTVIKD